MNLLIFFNTVEFFQDFLATWKIPFSKKNNRVYIRDDTKAFNHPENSWAWYGILLQKLAYLKNQDKKFKMA